MPSDSIPEWVVLRRRGVGERIRRARLHANLTQEKLAERVGIDRTTVIRIEAGSSAALLDHLFLIAEVLDVPLADLVRE